MNRMRTVSMRPPKNPDASPTDPPMNIATSAARNPTSSETRAPAISSGIMFAPPPSRPSGHSALGWPNTGPTFVFGSWLSSAGPTRATSTKKPRMSRPTIACGCVITAWRMKLGRRPVPRPAASSGVVPSSSPSADCSGWSRLTRSPAGRA